MELFLVILVVSGALVLGAAWGVFGRMSDPVEGFLVALAGGALIVSLTLELIAPALEQTSLAGATLALAAGAAVFTGADAWLAGRTRTGAGGWGLLLAVTLDGVPENLALGVSLIGADLREVAALAGAILLSNLPEAAGGAVQMRKNGLGRGRIMAVWAGTAALLSAAALAGNVALRGAAEGPIALIQCFAAGAVVSSLAVEVFPGAFREDRRWTGVAVAIGLILAVWLNALGEGAAF